MKPRILILLTLFAGLVKSNAQPVITRQPTNQSVSLGASARFQVSATTTNPPILFQWRFATNNVPNATSSSLALTNVQITNAGEYDAVLTDGSGSVTSRVALLEVDATFTKITTGAIVNSGGYGFGCAWGDYDDDGFIDLFVCNWSHATHDFLYHNLRDGTFERVTTAPQVSVDTYTTGAAWGDYDNDGKLDLFVTRPGGADTGFGPNTLYHNEGSGKFTRITTGLLVTQTLRSHAGVWADFDKDGLLDLFVVNFGVGDPATPALDNYLYHNNGNGSFLRTSFGAKTVMNGDSFDTAAADFNNDGWIDLLVPQGAGHGNPQNTLLYANNRNGTFTLLTNSIVFKNPANSAACAWGDYDNDGFLDVFISNNPEQNSLLYHNNGDGTFALVTNTIVGPDGGSSAGCAWGDYDLLSIAGDTGLRYLLEGSTNLVDWNWLGVGTNLTGSIQFADWRATNYLRRFYRVSIP